MFINHNKELKIENAQKSDETSLFNSGVKFYLSIEGEDLINVGELGKEISDWCKEVLDEDAELKRDTEIMHIIEDKYYNVICNRRFLWSDDEHAFDSNSFDKLNPNDLQHYINELTGIKFSAKINSVSELNNNTSDLFGDLINKWNMKFIADELETKVNLYGKDDKFYEFLSDVRSILDKNNIFYQINRVSNSSESSRPKFCGYIKISDARIRDINIRYIFQ